MFKPVLFILLSVVIFKNAAYGDIRLFLHAKATAGNGSLALRDIASIEGNYPYMERIRDIKIESWIYSDGYIDKKEISLLLKKYTGDNIYIYGNAVRVLDNEQAGKAYPDQANEFLVRKGDTVDIVVKKKGVSLMLKGTVVNEGKLDEEIYVKLENKPGALPRLVKGKVKGKDMIEIIL